MNSLELRLAEMMTFNSRQSIYPMMRMIAHKNWTAIGMR
jgi:hypothetical protein